MQIRAIVLGRAFSISVSSAPTRKATGRASPKFFRVRVSRRFLKRQSCNRVAQILHAQLSNKSPRLRADFWFPKSGAVADGVCSLWSRPAKLFAPATPRARARRVLWHQDISGATSKAAFYLLMPRSLARTNSIRCKTSGSSGSFFSIFVSALGMESPSRNKIL